MKPGETVEIAGYRVIFNGVERLAGPNYTSQRGSFAVFKKTEKIADLFPEKRDYPAENSSTTEAAIHTNFYSDIYVVLGDLDKTNGWVTRLYYNPLVPWIWGGAIMMALGGCLSLSDRRLRIGAPRSASATSSATRL